MLLIIILFCFCEESNYSYNFFSNKSLFFDSEQLSLHTFSDIDDIFFISDLLGFLYMVILPSMYYFRSKRNQKYFSILFIPLFLLILLICCNDNWNPHLFKLNGKFICRVNSEEIYETLLASTAWFYSMILNLKKDIF